MVSDELVSMTAIYDAAPHFAPMSIVWGLFSSDPDIHFFFCLFYEMSIDEPPDIEPFCVNVAALHRNGKSPTGKYEFLVCTF